MHDAVVRHQRAMIEQLTSHDVDSVWNELLDAQTKLEKLGQAMPEHILTGIHIKLGYAAPIINCHHHNLLAE